MIAIFIAFQYSVHISYIYIYILQINILCILHARMVNQDFDLSSLRTVFLAGERADPDTLKWAETALKVSLFVLFFCFGFLFCAF